MSKRIKNNTNSKVRKLPEYIRSCRTCIFANFRLNRCEVPKPTCIFVNPINMDFKKMFNISYEDPFSLCKTWKAASRKVIRDRFKKFETIISSDEF